MTNALLRTCALGVTLFVTGVAIAQPTVPAPQQGAPFNFQPPVAPPTTPTGPQQIQISTSHAEAARQLLTATRAIEPFMQILPNMLRQAQSVILQSNLAIQTEPPKRQALEETLRTIEGQLAGERDQLVAGIALLYAARFTEAELNQLNQFATSPIGVKYFQLTPVIGQESIRSATAWADRVNQGLFTRIREEMRRRGHPLN